MTVRPTPTAASVADALGVLVAAHSGRLGRAADVSPVWSMDDDCYRFIVTLPSGDHFDLAVIRVPE